MTNVENVNGQADDVQDKKQRKHDSGAADLERVTDWTEETEISKDISNVNNSGIIHIQWLMFFSISGCKHVR